LLFSSALSRHLREKWTIMQNRDRTDIIRQILDITNGSENITKSKIMYEAFLSYKQLKDYLTLLTEKDLLSYDPLSRKYKTTEKGIRLLQFCNQLDDMIKKASPTQLRR
jgi:predicted transcriptional regulator